MAYAGRYLQSEWHGQAQFARFTYGQGRPHLGFEHLEATQIALPPLAEQHRIVAEVDRLLSVADETEQAVRAQLVRAKRLRQAVLKRAFEGKLVPQDPNDEPASAMLERMRAQQTEEPGQSGAKKKRGPGRARLQQQLDLGEEHHG